MRILVISRDIWKENNNTGNTLTSLFGDFNNCELFNLYLKDVSYCNPIVKRTFHIQEKLMIKHPFTESGEELFGTNYSLTSEKKKVKPESYLLRFFREIVWTFGTWKGNKLKTFLSEVNPEIVFMPVFPCFYAHKLLNYINKTFPAIKIVLFHADDTYSLKCFSFSPLFWLYRLFLRKYVKESVKISSLNFAISDLQQNEYSSYFAKRFFLLQKTSTFLGKKDRKENKPLTIVYTGNLSNGRWKTIKLIAKALEHINNDSKKAILLVYSQTKLSKRRMSKTFDNINSRFMGSVEAGLVYERQSNADILLHVESFSKTDISATRLSFSTKIIDYLSFGKCILAVGPNCIASIQFFLNNSIGYLISNKNDIEEKLRILLESSNTRKTIGERCFEYGKKNHSESHFRDIILETLGDSNAK